MKTDVDNYSIDDFKKEGKTLWDGVRNYQARNFMMKNMNVGDKVFFYHSNGTPSGIAGLATISKKATADITALQKKSKYYDPKATKENPRWFCVEVTFKKKLNKLLSIQELRQKPQLKNLSLLKKGQRLSILPIEKFEYEFILKILEKMLK